MLELRQREKILPPSILVQAEGSSEGDGSSGDADVLDTASECMDPEAREGRGPQDDNASCTDDCQRGQCRANFKGKVRGVGQSLP